MSSAAQNRLLKSQRTLHGVAVDPKYHWKPGQSGNPGGRPKGVIDVRIALQARTAECLALLVKTVRLGTATVDRVRANGWGTDTDATFIRLGQTAAETILERAWGKPVNLDDSGKGLDAVSAISITIHVDGDAKDASAPGLPAPRVPRYLKAHPREAKTTNGATS